MDEMLKDLVTGLEEILNVEDDKFPYVKDLALQTLNSTMTGPRADNEMLRTISVSKLAGISRSEFMKQNQSVNEFVYKLITEEYKTRYRNPIKHEFLDIFYAMIEEYTDNIIRLWDIDSPTIHVQLLREGAKTPAYASLGDQGADIYACEDVIIPAHSFGTIVKTGIAVAIPHGWALAVRPRSGMSCKTCIRISNTPGTIDTNYKDEIGVIIDNFSDEAYVIHAGDRIAQFVLEKNYQAMFVETEDVHDHGEDRGGGFGHSGV